MSNNNKNKVRHTAIGGQALIEGVLMKGRKNVAICVRKPDGELEKKVESLNKVEKISIFNLPIFRGMKILISTMILGTKALMYSAEFYADTDEYEKSKFDLWIEDKFKEKANDIILAISLVMSIVIAVFMFAVLPVFVTSFLRSTIKSAYLLSLFEGVFKIALFVGYVALISRMKEVKRVFQYHGAEHKVIHCFEAGEELTPENAAKFTTLHPRCGTSFLILVLLISVAVFTFVSWDSVILRMVYKVLLLPVVAGISFEVIKLTATSNNPILKLIGLPGLYLQKLTTNEPDLSQLEVAIESLKLVLENEEADI